MRRPSLSLSLLLASGTLALAAFACGGISDPTRNGAERVATVSGALTGTAVPANARVALVWRKGGAGGLEVGADVAIVGGKFTMNLVAPPDSFHAPLEADEVSVIGSTPPSTGGAAPTDPSPGSSTSGSPGTGTGGGAPKGASSSKAVPGGMTLRTKDNATGTIITQPMGAAFAGFVVYADTNGNSKLDLTGPYGDSPDTILGGNDDLILVHLQGGGQLDLEKLRDKSGILPTAGFNLAWDEGRWLPLNLVELKLNPKEGLPNEVCGGSGVDYPGSSGGVPEPKPMPDTPPSSSGSTSSGSSSGSSGWGGPYPAPGSPGLKCSPDGRSFTYQQPCPPPPPAPTGLCAGDIATTSACAGGYGADLGPGQTVPSGWPCAVSEPVDGGPAPDAGSSGSSTSSSGG